MAIALSTPIVFSDSSLQQFASLAISGGRGGPPSLHSPTLSLLYLTSGGHGELMAELLAERVFPRDASRHPHWIVLVPKIVQTMIKSLYPCYTGLSR